MLKYATCDVESNDGWVCTLPPHPGRTHVGTVDETSGDYSKARICAIWVEPETSGETLLWEEN